MYKKKAKVPKQNLDDARIYIPVSEEDAHSEAIRQLNRDIRIHGQDLGDGTLDEDALYIRHEHRLHLPHDPISNKVTASGINPAHHIDDLFGSCVACLGPSDTFGELSIHRLDGQTEQEEEEEDDDDEGITDISAGNEVHLATTRAHGSIQYGNKYTVRPPSTRHLSRRKSLRAKRKTHLSYEGCDNPDAPRRTATVISREPSEFLIIDNTTFDKLLKDAMINFEPELARRVLSKVSSKRSKDDVKILKDLLHTIEFFKEMPTNILTKLCKCIKLRAFEKGDFVYRQGEPADCMYVVLSGKVSISKVHNESKRTNTALDNSRRVLEDHRKQAVVLASLKIASTDSIEANLDMDKVATEESGNSINGIEKKPKVSRSLKQVVEHEEKFITNQFQGENNPKISLDEREAEGLISTATIGDCLGEKSLMATNHMRQMTVKTLSVTAELIQISRADFDEIIADHVDELDFHANLTYRAVHDACHRGKVPEMLK